MEDDAFSFWLASLTADIPPEAPPLPRDLSSGHEQMIRTRDARIADLERALSALYRECLAAGLGEARDFLWPSVMDSARRALSPEQPKQ